MTNPNIISESFDTPGSNHYLVLTIDIVDKNHMTQVPSKFEVDFFFFSKIQVH